MHMEKRCYYFRHKVDQGLFVYLELDETWEDTFLMEYRITETKPNWIKAGSLNENRHILLQFKDAALTSPQEKNEDKKFEWKTIQPDVQLEYVTKTFIDSYVKQ